ncbi:MAG: hypothetical protein OXK74_15155 [Gemmatimonadota bacterium]|nr:hypothetical protein [Gemmatimonadota bacterium]
MNARNGMQAMRVRAVTTLKITAVAAVLSFTAPFVGTTAPVSAQAKPWPERVIQVGPFRVCFLICWGPGYCCKWVGQL